MTIQRHDHLIGDHHHTTGPARPAGPKGLTPDFGLIEQTLADPNRITAVSQADLDRRTYAMRSGFCGGLIERAR